MIFTRLLRKLNDMKWEVIYAWQRLFAGHDEKMAFSFYSEHSELVVRALRDMRANTHGHPVDMDMDQWLGILDTIIDGFKAVDDLDNPPFAYYTSGPIRDFNKKMDEHEKAAWAEWKKSNAVWDSECMARWDKGMDLFKEYYFNLWD